MSHLNAIVKGRVQGVGYRFFVLETARRMKLTGFVKNLPNGDVEVQAEGPEEKLKDFVAALKKGPAFARVIDISTEFMDEERGFETFDISFY